jgi:hypothetical protein
MSGMELCWYVIMHSVCCYGSLQTRLKARSVLLFCVSSVNGTQIQIRQRVETNNDGNRNKKKLRCLEQFYRHY